MKEGDEATEQFNELAVALREVGAGQIVDEVLGTIARGQSVRLSELDEEDLAVRRTQLAELRAERPAVDDFDATEETARAYRPDEQLQQLVSAAIWFVLNNLNLRTSVAAFAAEQTVESIHFEAPGTVSPGAEAASANIPLEVDPTRNPSRILNLLVEAYS